MIIKERNRLVYSFDGENLWIEPWGKNSLRVRSSKKAKINEDLQWALLNPEPIAAEITVSDKSGSIANGKIRCELNQYGWLTFYNDKNELLLEEWWRVKDGGDKTSALEIRGREFKPLIGNEDFKITMRFEPNKGEKIYGLGQRQEVQLDMKGCTLELAQRNSQACVPFALSNKGYGFLWNNPSIGRVTFANNITEWIAEVADQLDYWITAGDTPAEIEEAYADAVGKTPMMPDFAMGFWQCKLRYRTQEELLNIAREYKKRGLPISVIVSDFFHWPQQGEWKFDPKYWPDPDAMIKELKDMGIELMVSIWPTVDVNSENYDEMEEKGYLLRSERATRTSMNFQGNEIFFDSSNPDSREYVWSKAKKNYYDKGIRLFWLDEAEPDFMGHYDYDTYRYWAGPAVKVSSLYPVNYAKTFYEGMEKEGQKNILNLIRCVWAGSQKYGTLLWSGDVHSTFECLRRQFAAGLNAGISGIPWWTTDIGGFTGGNGEDPKFRELLVRWFQFGVFCPVTRLHGFRNPVEGEIFDAWREFNKPFGTGAANEIWSYGEEVYNILKDLLFTRERIRPYVKEQMIRAHDRGTPVIRPLFYDFSKDSKAWETEDEFMFGPDILVAPVLYEGWKSRDVYLPVGEKWTDAITGKDYEGGQTIKCDAPLNVIPVFVRTGKAISVF
jgi:alpha-D-xyloside xylohydrolase